MRQKISFLIIGILIGALLCTLCVGTNAVFPNESSSAKKTLKLAHGLDTKHPVHIAMLELKKIVEEMSGGSLSLNVYAGGVLGNEIQCLEQLRNGSLDMTKASSAQIASFAPQTALLALPYLYENKTHYWKVLDSEIGKDFLKKLNTFGLVGLCYYDAGARSFYTSKKKVTSPEDLKGMKIRVMNSRTDMEMIKCFDASPTPVSAGETYTSLAQGLVDGAENNLPTYFTSAHYEVSKYFTFDEHTRIPDILLIGESTWKSLTDKEREILREATRKSSLFQREIWAKSEEDAKEKLKGKGVVFTDVDKSKFREMAKKIYESYSGEDAEILKKIKEKCVNE